MKRTGPSLLILSLFSYGMLYAQKEIRLPSPDGSVVFNFRLNEGTPQYKVLFNGQILVNYSSLNLSFQETGSLKGQLLAGKPVYRAGDEAYELVVGKAKHVRSHFREVSVPLQEKKSTARKIILVVRVFNDGVAFRYEFPAQPNWASYALTEERSDFNLAGNPTIHTLFLSSFTTSHEGQYSTLKLTEVKDDLLMDMPALFEFDNGIFMAITEAALVDYAGMYLSKRNGILSSRLSPLPGGNGVLVKASLPHRSPWRVLMIGARVGALIESNILTNLNEPCAVGDVSWIKPGKTTFPWWNGNVLPDTINAPGNNFVTQQYYIDFCAANHIEYHSVVEYGLHEWYVNDGISFTPGPNADVTRAVPGLDMKQVCDYGRKKGVGIRVWVHWKALYPQLDKAFAQFEEWGLQGLMVDFMDRDDQEMVNIQQEILRKAADHKLHIQFHGAYKPTGLHRTYPNEFNREGTLNYEANKWSKVVTPDHDIHMPFTRMLAGATDYHLGGFRAVPMDKFKVQYTRPLMMGTRCHQLAMYVVLENYLGMVCDYPDAYIDQPGFEFLRVVPTVWDETKVVGADVDQWISMARRKDNDWYVGTITNGSEREIKLDLGFLPPGNFTATSYEDVSVDKPNELVKRTFSVKRTDQLTLRLAAGGGHTLHLRRTQP